MSFAFAIQAISPTSAGSTPHILGFSTARSVADDLLVDLWNGSTNAARVWKIDKDGRTIGGDGTVGKPGFSFDDDADCGMYRIGTNNIGLAVNGAKVVDIATTGVSVTGTLSVSGASTLTGDATFAGVAKFASGTAAAPGIAFSSDVNQNSGLYLIAENNIGVAAGGTKIIDVTTTGVSVVGTFSPSGAVTLGSTIRLPNATALLARNAADSADVTILLLSSTDDITLGALTSGDVNIIGGSANAVTIQAGGASKAIEVAGNASNPTLGFYGAEVVAQQAISGATADAALADLLDALETLGLIVDNTTFTP